MIMCVLLCYPVSIRIYYQQGILFLVFYLPSVEQILYQSYPYIHKKTPLTYILISDLN